MTDFVSSLIRNLLLISGSGVVGGVLIFIFNWYFYKFPKIEFNLRILDFVINRNITFELEVMNEGDTLASRIICHFSPNWGNSQTINIPDLHPNEKFTKNITVKITDVFQDLSIYTNIGYIRKLWIFKPKKVLEVEKTKVISVDEYTGNIRGIF